jgi:hypothetical protein
LTSKGQDIDVLGKKDSLSIDMKSPVLKNGDEMLLAFMYIVHV